MRKRQKETIGSIVEINIDGQYYVYAQILLGGYAFFDYKSEKKLDDISSLEKREVLFIVSVYKNAVTQGRWEKVGKLSIREEMKILPNKFIQDPFDPNLVQKYNPNTGEITPSTRDEVKELERAAVWEAEHVESRIRDYYKGVPNIWVKQLALKEI